MSISESVIKNMQKKHLNKKLYIIYKYSEKCNKHKKINERVFAIANKSNS
jgi:hypothetical protein